MKVETTLPLQKEARFLQFTKDESLASFQWCLLWIAHNYPLPFTNKTLLVLGWTGLYHLVRKKYLKKVTIKDY